MYILKIYYYWKGSASYSTTKFFCQFLFLWSKPMTLTRKEQMQITRLRITYSNAFASYQKTVSWILWILQNQQRRRIPTLLLYQIQRYKEKYPTMYNRFQLIVYDVKIYDEIYEVELKNFLKETPHLLHHL